MQNLNEDTITQAVIAHSAHTPPDRRRHDPGRAPDGATMDRPFYTLEYDFERKPTGAFARGGRA